MSDSIRQINISTVDETNFPQRYVGCLVLTHDEKILFQQRDSDCKRHPGYLATFGGMIEEGESPMQALIRELNEELGAVVEKKDVTAFGAITEKISDHKELVYIYFWQDTRRTITGCYEGKPAFYNAPEDVLKHPKIMNDVRWLLQECSKRKLL